MAKAEVKKQCMRYFQIFLGCFIVCMGFNLFLIQAHLLTGGLSGVALIIYYLTGIPVGMQNIEMASGEFLSSVFSPSSFFTLMGKADTFSKGPICPLLLIL